MHLLSWAEILDNISLRLQRVPNLGHIVAPRRGRKSSGYDSRDMYLRKNPINLSKRIHFIYGA